MERGRRGFARLSQRKTEKGVMLVPAAFTYLCWAVVSTAAVGYVPEALEMQHNFARIGFTNSAGEAPYFARSMASMAARCFANGVMMPTCLSGCAVRYASMRRTSCGAVFFSSVVSLGTST